MSNAQENYNIHICLESELTKLQQFIHNHWRKNHALVTSKELMDWQHYDGENKLYNFVIATYIKTNQIHGVLGFIPTCHFGKSIQGIDMWLAIWKVRDDVKVAGLGLSLLTFIVSRQPLRSISAVGLNPRVIPIYKYMGYKAGVLNHYYIINDRMTEFHLIGNFNGHYHKEVAAIDEKKMIRYEKSDFFQLSEESRIFTSSKQIPEKSCRYLYNRYICHPIYDYHVYGIMSRDSIVGFLILRLASHNSSHALRMVDYFGDVDGLSGIRGELQRLLRNYKAEYIDFYNIGIEEEVLSNGGFIKRASTSQVIIPNYFEPFEKRNVDLDYAYKCDDNIDFFICKGDSDQDRPNLLFS